jgi:hypothetical protein
MAKQKWIKVGSLIKTEKEFEVNGSKVKKTFLSIGLGNKNTKKPEYDQTVEIVVRNSKGEIVSTQKDGFLDVVDPRKEPDDLFAAGAIDEEMHGKMKENVAKLSDKVRYVLRLRTS